MSHYPAHGSDAWSRLNGKNVAKSSAGWDEYGRDTRDPFETFSATQIAKYFRKYFLPDLAGRDELEKFRLIFKKAPLWLLWFMET